MGTHPIFESDFDCLTVKKWQSDITMSGYGRKGLKDLIKRSNIPRSGAPEAAAVKQAKSAEGGMLPSIRGPLVRLMRDSYMRYGELQGVDARGNKYYLNNDYPMGRNRWVVYAEGNFEQRYDFDASDIPSEWHRWLHYMTDDAPTEAGVPPIERKFITEHVRNNTGTVDQYVPYTTTRKKVESWNSNE